MQSTKLKMIVEEIGICRTRVLDDCELELGDSPRWKLLRSRLLKIFGERGLEGKIVEIITHELSSEVDHD